MNKIELENIIKILEENASEEIGSFGLYYREGEDECHIKANQDGFLLFAIEMLKASLETEKVVENKEQNTITFGYEKDWYEGEVMIAYLKLVLETKGKILPDKKFIPTVKDDLVKFGCHLILIIIVLCLLVGAYTVVSWFF